VEHEPAIGLFEYDGSPLEAWIAGRYWRVRFDGREAEARTVGEALEEVLGSASLRSERRHRDDLILRILMWSRGDADLH
jgi:hypothetical protein